MILFLLLLYYYYNYNITNFAIAQLHIVDSAVHSNFVLWTLLARYTQLYQEFYKLSEGFSTGVVMRKFGFSGSSVWMTGLSCRRFGQSVKDRFILTTFWSEYSVHSGDSTSLGCTRMCLRVLSGQNSTWMSRRVRIRLTPTDSPLMYSRVMVVLSSWSSYSFLLLGHEYLRTKNPRGIHCAAMPLYTIFFPSSTCYRRWQCFPVPFINEGSSKLLKRLTVIVTPGWLVWTNLKQA